MLGVSPATLLFGCAVDGYKEVAGSEIHRGGVDGTRVKTEWGGGAA
jgi:hypothetical protein